MCTNTDYQDVPPCFEPECGMCPYKNMCRNYKGTKIVWNDEYNEPNTSYTVKVTSTYNTPGTSYVSP